MRAAKICMAIMGAGLLRIAEAQTQAPQVMPAKAQQVQQLSGRAAGGTSVSSQQSTAAGASGSSVNVLNTTIQVQGSYTGSVPEPTAQPGTLHLTLEDAVRRGIQTNLGPVGATASARQARGARLAALSQLLPSITGSLSENVARADLQSEGLSASIFGPSTASAGISFPAAVGPFHYYDAHVGVTEDLLDATALHNLRQSRASEHAAMLNAQDARELVIYAVAGTYLQILATIAQVDSQQVQVSYSEASYKQALAQNAVGTKAPIDTNKSLVELQTEKQRLLSRQTDLAKQKMQMARMIGLPPRQSLSFAESLPFTPAPAVTLDEAVQRALIKRADLQAAAAQLRAAEETVKASKSEYLPTAGISGTFGIQGANPNQATTVYTGSATLSIPIWQGGKVKADRLQADAAVTQRRAELTDQQGVVEIDVRSAWLDMTAATQQVEVAISNRRLALDTLKKSQDRFKAGVADSVEVVQSQESLASAEQDYISALYSHNLSKVALARAMGNAEQVIPELLKTSRTTGTDSGAPPEEQGSALTEWRHAVEPGALLKGNAQ